jgi:hypothetical protein
MRTAVLVTVCLVVGFVALASGTCTYTCWQVKPTASTFAACIAIYTLPIPFGDHTFIEEVHNGVECGTCAHDTDRRKACVQFNDGLDFMH